MKKVATQFLLILTLITLNSCVKFPDLNVESDNILAIYPNPVTDFTSILINPNQQGLLRIFDPNGKIFKEIQMDQTNNRIKVSFENQKVGKYQVIFITNQKAFNKQILKINH